MSRKNRFRKAARRPAQAPVSSPAAKVSSRPSDPGMRAKVLASVDGYSNAAAFLGKQMEE